MTKIKTIGILTSGGDAPGMNAAIRAVTRAGIYNQFNIKGIYRGYDGLIKGEVNVHNGERERYHHPGRNNPEDSPLEGVYDNGRYAEGL